ncbi:hypothetical protein BCR44DRAFT_286749 [Catenaria anguillulae PL171]|uniref:Uncharacterized protein n=1 Tax=Catenaria anguillulae PL171 TaxID=765915 RepID=A0A1Y2HRT8_9FUNG|nr:hypothetical protein BCR44DRAFT_286749 [Catenaria anguillulae PL171]
MGTSSKSRSSSSSSSASICSSPALASNMDPATPPSSSLTSANTEHPSASALCTNPCTCSLHATTRPIALLTSASLEKCTRVASSAVKHESNLGSTWITARRYARSTSASNAGATCPSPHGSAADADLKPCKLISSRYVVDPSPNAADISAYVWGTGDDDRAAEAIGRPSFMSAASISSTVGAAMLSMAVNCARKSDRDGSRLSAWSRADWRAAARDSTVACWAARSAASCARKGEKSMEYVDWRRSRKVAS